MNHARNIASALHARRALRRAPQDLDAAWDYVRGFNIGERSLFPMQIESEFRRFLTLVHEHPPRAAIEVGTANGGSLFLLTRAVSPSAHIVTIDLPGSTQFGGELGQSRSVPWMLKGVTLQDQKLRLIRGDSHSPDVITAVARFVPHADLLFIDGDHSYDGVKADFENYSPLVTSGGVIAFHDIVEGPPEHVGGVPDFWAELKASGRYQYLEIVESWRQGGRGIGVLAG